MASFIPFFADYCCCHLQTDTTDFKKNVQRDITVMTINMSIFILPKYHHQSNISLYGVSRHRFCSVVVSISTVWCILGCFLIRSANDKPQTEREREREREISLCRNRH